MNIAYELVNKPWRTRVILRAIRVGRLIEQRREADHIAWAREVARETRRARLLALYGGALHPWQREMLLTLHSGDPGIDGDQNIVGSVPYQHPMRGPVTWSTADGSSPIVTRLGVYTAPVGGELIMADNDVPPWMRRLVEEDDEL